MTKKDREDDELFDALDPKKPRENNSKNIDKSILGGIMRREELYRKLKEPFPPEAYAIDKSRGGNKNPAAWLTTIRAQYIIDRLNSVFGLGGWSMTGELDTIRDENQRIISALFSGTLVASCNDINIKIENIGYAEQSVAGNRLGGDILKSARTDCLSKCASWIGVGDAVFKGLVKVDGGRPRPPQQSAISEKKQETLKDILEIVDRVTKTMNEEDGRAWKRTALRCGTMAELKAKSEEELEEIKTILVMQQEMGW